MGALAIRSVLRRCTPTALWVLPIAAVGFLTYECIEYVNVHDDPHKDIFNFMGR